LAESFAKAWLPYMQANKMEQNGVIGITILSQKVMDQAIRRRMKRMRMRWMMKKLKRMKIMIYLN
jgi:hypothetical protein